MEGVSNLLGKFSVEDIEKLKLLFTIASTGNQQQSEIIEKNEVVTLRVFAEEYLNLIKHSKAESYCKSVLLSFNHMFSFFSAQKSISSLQLKDIEDFFVYLQQKVKKGYYVYFRNLKAAFNKAVDWKYVKENYFIRVKLPRKQKLAPLFITTPQFEIISKQIKNGLVKEISTFAFYTGLRLNEIVNLKWKNVNLSSGIITVGDEEFVTKGKNQRYIPICEEVREVLRRNQRSEVKGQQYEVRGQKSEVRSPCLTAGKQKSVARSQKENTCDNVPNIIPINKINGYVFCKENGERFSGDYVSKRFKRACRVAGVDKAIHFHTLRHSFASNLVQKGVSLYTVKELLGHSSISTTEIYSHLDVETLRKAIRVLDG